MPPHWRGRWRSEDATPDPERQAAHRGAATLLREAGAPAEALAAHLGRLTPAADTEVAETLAAAGGDAMNRAAPEEAVAWLQRAIDEGASTPDPAGMLVSLGVAKAALRDPASLATVHEAYARAAGPQRVRIGILLAELLAHSGQWQACRDVIASLESELETDEDALIAELAAIRAAATIFDSARAAEFHARRDEYERIASLGHWGSRAVSALLGAGAAAGGRPQEAVAHARRARAGGGLFTERGAGGWASPQLLMAYILPDELQTAAVVCDELEAAARAAGSTLGLLTAATYRAWLQARRGELPGAEAVLESAVTLARESGMLMFLTTAAFLLVDVVLERSLSQIAAVVEGTELPPDFLATSSGAMLLETRGRLRIAGHDRAGAIADLRAAGEINDALRFGPPMTVWRSELALALSPERPDEARDLAGEELGRARASGLARPVGVALRALGIVSGGAEGDQLLAESIEVLRGSPARLELARSLVAWGAMLRRANRRSESRGPLTEGLRLAHECGALRLRERAEQELAASGGRRPRLFTSGRDALTASELRVAQLAASGAANAEIAQALYVSVKTVETHLSRSYDKLGLAGPGSRAKLAPALSAADGGVRAD